MAAVYSAGLALGIDAPASAETLAEAIALAYDSNPTLQAQRATQRALDESWVQARSGYRPNASLGGSFSYSEVRTPGGAGLVDTNGDGIRDTIVRGKREENNASATL
ncbi:MAG TPA: TolC family protein, partial [Phenylobacterium sp.]|nr:TolC family protein [Phenylobacterium sp.]